MSLSDEEGCDDGEIKVTAEEGYIAGGSDLTPEGMTTQSVPCTWIIEAQTGQRINITMINFNYKGLKGYRYGYRRRGHTGITCTDVATITDEDIEKNIRLCEDQPRQTQVYLSSSDTVKLQIIQRAATSKSQALAGLFLLHYKGSVSGLFLHIWKSEQSF